MPDRPEIQDLIQSLHAKKQGKDWRGDCPVCSQDNLAFREKNDKIVIRCWSGCDNNLIIRKLDEMGLWPKPNTRIEQDPISGKLRQEARNWKLGIVPHLEMALARRSQKLQSGKEFSGDELRQWHQDTTLLAKLTSRLQSHELVSLYRDALGENEALARTAERVGRDVVGWERKIESMLSSGDSPGVRDYGNLSPGDIDIGMNLKRDWMNRFSHE